MRWLLEDAGHPLLDLATVELDIVALERGYARPAEPAHHAWARVLATDA